VLTEVGYKWSFLYQPSLYLEGFEAAESELLSTSCGVSTSGKSCIPKSNNW